MEALASGTPVVAFPNGALSEIVVPQRTGFLVNSAEEMAEAIGEVDSLSPNLCRREAEARFSSGRMFAQYLDLYRSVLTSETVSQLEAV
jgi:glycosyltransferase involved in cell wall biosynthesis